MREIKFRAWYACEQRYIDDGFAISQDGLFLYLDDLQEYGIPEDFIVEQFTGSYDKNGKEIYEGDIILNPLYEEPYIVEYSEYLAGYVGWGDDRACGCYLITDEDIEVIGDIHENPELIK